jgi:hypothetical protein
MLQGAGLWAGGGFGPGQLDRTEISARLDPPIPRWILDPLLDAYEAAVTRHLNDQAEARKKRRPAAPPERGKTHKD